MLEAMRAAGSRAADVDETLYPRVRTVSFGARVVAEGVDVEVTPSDEARDTRPGWAAKWSTFDHRFTPRMQAEIERLAHASPPWVDLQAVLHAGAEAGARTSEAALRRALEASIAAAGPVERPRLGPEVVVLAGG